MIRNVLSYLVLFLLTNVARAQTAEPLPLPVIERDRKWVVSMNPLTLFDPDNTIQFGIERLLGQRNSLQLEMGYGTRGMNIFHFGGRSKYPDRENWRARIEWRYYLRKTNEPSGRYVAFDVFYKQINATLNGYLPMGCEDGMCQYYQYQRSLAYKYVYGGNVKIGRQFSLSANSRFTGDLYVGIGIRWRQIQRSTSDLDGFRGIFAIDLFSPEPHVVPNLALGWKFGYRF